MNEIFGIRPVIEAIESGKNIEKVFFRKGLKGKLFSELFYMVKERNISFQFVSEQWFGKYGNKNTQGVVAIVSLIEYTGLEDLAYFALEKQENPILIFLDGITDVRNFGAIARTAECAGVSGLIIKSKKSAPVNADAIKTSAGALLRIPVSKVNSPVKAVEYLKNSGFTIIAATEKAQQNHFEISYDFPAVIIMGAEDKGISQELLKISDYQVKIPVLGEIKSLNVAVATGIIVYEAVRQRLTGQRYK